MPIIIIIIIILAVGRGGCKWVISLPGVNNVSIVEDELIE
jgi:hypothetical protein